MDIMFKKKLKYSPTQTSKNREEKISLDLLIVFEERGVVLAAPLLLGLGRVVASTQKTESKIG